MSDLNLKVVAGSATADEVAAIMAVITALSNTAPNTRNNDSSNWSNPTRLQRKPLPTSWSNSYLTR